MADQQGLGELIKHLSDKYGAAFGVDQQAELLQSVAGLAQSAKASATAEVASSDCSIYLSAYVAPTGWMFIGSGQAGFSITDGWEGNSSGTISYNNFDEVVEITTCYWASGETYLSLTFFSGWTVVASYSGDIDNGSVNLGVATGSWSSGSNQDSV